jgi:hypothetical protein
MLLQVQQECAATGFLAITGHGISNQQLQQLFATARQLFDLSYEVKMQLVVKDMQAGRGYEISPEHKAYMQVGVWCSFCHGRWGTVMFVRSLGMRLPGALTRMTTWLMQRGGVVPGAVFDALRRIPRQSCGWSTLAAT